MNTCAWITVSIYVFISVRWSPTSRATRWLCLTIWGTAKLFSKGAALFYIPTSNAWGFPLLSKYHIIYSNKTVEWNLNFFVVLFFLGLHPTKTVQSTVLSSPNSILCVVCHQLDISLTLFSSIFSWHDFFEYVKHFHGPKVKTFKKIYLKKKTILIYLS